MAPNNLRLSDYVRVEQNDDALVLKAREETGRGKQFGSAGEIALDEEEAELLARWVFARGFQA